MADSSKKSFDLLNRAPNPWPAPGHRERHTNKYGQRAPPPRFSDSDSDVNPYLYLKKSPKRGNPNLHPAANRKKFIPAVQKLLDVEKTHHNNDHINARDAYYDAYSYGTGQKFLPNYEKLCETPSPRGLTRRGYHLPTRGKKTFPPRRPIHQLPKPRPIDIPSPQAPPIIPSLMSNLLEPFETLTIETSRKVIREGGVHFEEVNIIKFPKNLPPNIQVITHHQK